MATPAAQKRLTKEFAMISKNPPEFITAAHPSESNILEWHALISGAPNTPYAGGQYWCTLIFPPDYPFAPPAIRMHTPSGRFQTNTRLCLSISDYHPKSFNPAWSVSTILIGLMSFMNSEEMTAGSIGGSEAERKWHATRSRWFNSTGGGSASKPVAGVQPTTKGIGGIKAGDGGRKFKAEFPEEDKENWEWMTTHRIDPATGKILPDPEGEPINCSPETKVIRRILGGSAAGVGAVVQGGQAARNAGRGWIWRNKFWVGAGFFVVYVMLARLLGQDD
ncbi:Ubiquitin-conjugating enzyme E2 6 [Exophiala xenobiotica]|nr:Ubiquitin-conjugating enzyme E2 6 [Exophiala xenobiotica]KAK5399576.1 Ubiquitin-conjugating enzyme E2 6 [Exophiala xenobiotica]KAK5416336.1 Ubiquitin-conjugating enzyme E2 6 [Exophiala xenobiotica]KAK5458580.1 Ubiquitin-conjugating enzyme E2 6 [Exophiala xenobiotica]KAK5490979.1 Ubiquitin-conjugating enzyme E2 6 [Exophiala xenobiotica]